MSLDLSNPIDFARATLSPISAFLQAAIGGNPSDWQITEGSYISNYTLAKNSSPVVAAARVQPVKFLIISSTPTYLTGVNEIRDSGGRRLSKIVYPYQDGATTDDLGRRSETFTVTVLFFGNNYTTGLNALITELNQPGPGVLEHPVRGKIPVAFEDHEFVHSAETRKGALIKLTFFERTFSIQSLAQQPGNTATPNNTVKSALLTALGFVSKVSSAVDTIQATFFATRSQATLLVAALKSFQNAYSNFLQQFNISFNVGSSLDLLSILPTSDGGNAGVGTTPSSAFPVIQSSADPFTAITSLQSASTVTAITTQQATNLVNGLRDQIQSIINQYNASQNGLGPVIFYSDIFNLVQTGVNLQNMLQAAIASSNPQIFQYNTPRLMTVREVCFAIGIDVNRSIEVELLNPQLESVNYIPQGTQLQVPAQ